MATLHLINTSSMQTPAVRDCLASIAKEDAIVLLEDGVYLYQHLNQSLHNKLFVIEDDVQARGIQNEIAATDFAISYERFVELICQYKNSISWF